MSGPHTSKYVPGCGCESCRKYINAQRNQQRLKAIERERSGRVFEYDRVDVVPIRNAIKQSGLSLADVQRVTGVGRSTITRIMSDRTKTIWAGTAWTIESALKKVEEQGNIPRPGAYINGARYKHLISGLLAQGYTYDHLSYIVENNLGAKIKFGTVNKKSSRYVTYQTAQAIEWLVRSIGDSTGPSTQTSNRMMKRGIFPLKHYDANGRLNVRTLSREQRRYVQ